MLPKGPKLRNESEVDISCANVGSTQKIIAEIQSTNEGVAIAALKKAENEVKDFFLKLKTNQ